MSDLIELQKILIPDLLDVMQQRYSILQNVNLFQPVGRRTLAENANLTERNVRSEINFLQNQGLIQVTTKGMYITKAGKLLLENLTGFMSERKELSVLEKQVGEILQIKNMIIVPGNSDDDIWVKQEMGKACVEFLKSIVEKSNTIAVTGGSTMAAVADMMRPLDKQKEYLFVPARGGIGEKMENQASRIVSDMAKKTGGEYRLLHAPDPLSESAYNSLMQEPAINEILQLMKNANIVIHGVGDALTMAKRRRTTSDIITRLQEGHAVSEAFGYYFDEEGSVVHRVKTLGIHLDDLDTVDHVITVAGGKSKAPAIKSFLKQGKSHLLITDEAAANEILRGNPL